MDKKYYIIGGLLIGGIIIYLMNKNKSSGESTALKTIVNDIAPKIEIPEVK